MLANGNIIYLKSAVLLLFLLSAMPLLAQRKKSEDVVKLKNGSIIRGKLLEPEADSIIKIETEGRNVFVFGSSEVRNISKEPIPFLYKKSGYIFEMEVGMLSGRTFSNTWWPRQSRPVTNFTMQIVNGYQFNPYLSLGVGVGLDTYPESTITPLFLRAEGNFFKSRVTPIYILDTGYGFYSKLFNASIDGNGTRFRGGAMINPALGIRVHLGKYSSFFVSSGYRMQTYHSNIAMFGTPGDRMENKITYKRLSLRMGFSF